MQALRSENFFILAPFRQVAVLSSSLPVKGATIPQNEPIHCAVFRLHAHASLTNGLVNPRRVFAAHVLRLPVASHRKIAFRPWEGITAKQDFKDLKTIVINGPLLD